MGMNETPTHVPVLTQCLIQCQEYQAAFPLMLDHIQAVYLHAVAHTHAKGANPGFYLP